MICGIARLWIAVGVGNGMGVDVREVVRSLDRPRVSHVDWGGGVVTPGPKNSALGVEEFSWLGWDEKSFVVVEEVVLSVPSRFRLPIVAELENERTVRKNEDIISRLWKKKRDLLFMSINLDLRTTLQNRCVMD